ncbi:MAG: hypothetical protein J5I50_06990 [Chitinophagaceae bacterium]|nr:hypothetical protein [Chitinophagaceae bacterium]
MSKYLYGYSRRVLGQNERTEIQKKLGYFKSSALISNQLSFADKKFLFIENQGSNFHQEPTLEWYISLPGLNHTSLKVIDVKESDDQINIGSDTTGDRVIWYYSDENWFLISNSQFFITRLIGNYEANEEAWTWMLSNGCLGPGHSWDKRIKAMPPEGSLTFSKTNWSVTEKQNLWRFKYRPSNRSEMYNRLQDVLFSVADQYDFPIDETILNLSGGHDSRAALYLLKKKHPGFHTATWGTSGSFLEEGTDAFIARQVSRAWGTHHKEFNVELQGDFETNLTKFLFNTEGRNDHFNSFMDGQKMWETIAGMGYKYAVRADQAFGWWPVRSELDVRILEGIAQLSDFKNIPPEVANSYSNSKVPDYIKRYENENLEDYRDRLFVNYHLTFVVGPLQDIPLKYVEMANPLFHPEILKFIRTLPPKFRTNKNLYAQWVDTLLPNIPYAKKTAIPLPFEILSSAKTKDFLNSFINDPSSRHLLGAPIIDFLNKNSGGQQGEKFHYQRRPKFLFEKYVPTTIKKFIRHHIVGYTLPISSLLIRAFIIYKMQKTFKEVAD